MKRRNNDRLVAIALQVLGYLQSIGFSAVKVLREKAVYK